MSSGYPEDWNQRRRKVFKRDGWTCQCCKRKGAGAGSAELHAHHITPKSKGGGHELDNLTTLCDRCHAEYHDNPNLRADSGNDGSPVAAHFLLLIFTLGLGNILYEYNRQKDNISRKEKRMREKGIMELKRRERNPNKYSDSKQPRGYWHDQVDAGYNDEFDGCPSCGEKALSVRWEPDASKKTKIIRCGECSAQFDETVEDGELQLDRISGKSSSTSVSSAFEHELEKHLELGSFDGRSISEIKEELLKEADTQREKDAIRSKLDDFEKSGGDTTDKYTNATTTDKNETRVDERNSEGGRDLDRRVRYKKFVKSAKKFDQYPDKGTRSENNGTPSLPTLAHYGLEAAIDEDLTGVIRSQTKPFLAASCAAIRGETAEEAKEYLDLKKPGLENELETAFAEAIKSRKHSPPVKVSGTVNGGGIPEGSGPGLAACVCAALVTIRNIDPVERTEQALGK